MFRLTWRRSDWGRAVMREPVAITWASNLSNALMVADSVTTLKVWIIYDGSN